KECGRRAELHVYLGGTRQVGSRPGRCLHLPPHRRGKCRRRRRGHGDVWRLRAVPDVPATCRPCDVSPQGHRPRASSPRKTSRPGRLGGGLSLPGSPPRRPGPPSRNTTPGLIEDSNPLRVPSCSDPTHDNLGYVNLVRESGSDARADAPLGTPLLSTRAQAASSIASSIAPTDSGVPRSSTPFE